VILSIGATALLPIGRPDGSELKVLHAMEILSIGAAVLLLLIWLTGF
jgi:hypothetical protein